MDTWSLILVSALAGVRVQPLGTITMENKDACVAALESIKYPAELPDDGAFLNESFRWTSGNVTTFVRQTKIECPRVYWAS
jgi:hypothetical protein